MQQSYVISSHVVDTIKALPEPDRKAIAIALSSELLLDADPKDTLSPFQAMIYTIIRFYVKRDTERRNIF